MASHLCVSIRFLDPVFHGRRDRGEPEWPPSPMRVFQSLVATAAARLRQQAFSPEVQSAFEWLEQQPAPVIAASSGIPASGYRLSVPNNAMDIVAKAWCRGNYSNSGDASPARHRTMKTVRPTLMIGGDAVHYLWSLAEPITDKVHSYVHVLSENARSVVTLGWGVDLAVGHAALVLDEQVNALPGDRWLPITSARGDGLRVPVQGTLVALRHRHERFLKRLDGDVFTAPPPLTQYGTVVYRPETEPAPRSVAAFSLRRLDDTGYRAFDTPRRALTVAGMLRHTAKNAATRAGRPAEWINTFVLGHGESKDKTAHVPVGTRRFAYLPVPSIERKGEGRALVIGGVRRVMLCSFANGSDSEIAWARRALSGQGLVDEDTGEIVAVLSQVRGNDWTVQQYVQRSSSWATVTPVVLPGYDDPAHYRRRLKRGTGAEEQKQLLERLGDRIDRLLRKAITQAGFTQSLADNAELEYRNGGFWPGVGPASAYGVPDHLKRFPRLHVRIRWRGAHGQPLHVPGPVCLGGGRFYGLGLFATY